MDNQNPRLHQRMWRKIKDFFKRLQARKRSPLEVIETRKKQFATDLKKISETGGARELKLFFLINLDMLFSTEFEVLGISDGRQEINPRLATNFMRFKAKEVQGLIEGVFMGAARVAETDKVARENDLETAKESLEAQKAYAQNIEKKYRFNYKDFAVIIGFLYILFSIGFLIADFPLSKLVIQQGFEIENEYEVWLLAVGVTMIGVYFKIWWDEYINPAVEKIVTKNMVENLEGFEGLPEQEQKDGIVTVKKWRNLRAILKTGILLTGLVSIGVLGYFRYIVYLDNQYVLKNKPVPPTLESFTAKLGFILIAVLFPFLGGICLSIGTDRVQNWRERWRARRDLKKRAAAHERALTAKERAQKELEESKEHLKWCTHEKFIKECIDLFLSRYSRGYDIGLTNANLEFNILNKAENVRRRMLGKNTYPRTQPMINEEWLSRN